MTDIFSLSYLEDLPTEIKESISVDVFASRIIALFELANRPLSVDELTVGYYRKYRDEDLKTKRQITVKVYNMAKEKNSKIKSVEGKKGIYELKEKIEDFTTFMDLNEEVPPF